MNDFILLRDVWKTVDMPAVATSGDLADVLHIVRGVGLTCPQGASMSLVGPSGSGKSTLLGLMAGLDHVTSGHVQLGNDVMSEYNETQRAQCRARHVGFVFQSFQLLNHLTALENVLLPVLLLGGREEDAEQALARVGLSHRLHALPTTLSGGEQQRVSLARAIVRKPSVLFADEPTGSLDAETGQRVMDLLFELVAERGVTLVLVTHDAQHASRCSVQYRMNAGAVTRVA